MSKMNRTLYDNERLPQHIAIIMDGNGRWAKKRFMPRQAGHKAGIEALRRTIETVIDLGIPVLTVYAFSTENWKRPADEVNHLMNLLLEYLTTELSNLHEKNIKLNILGDQQALSDRIREELAVACSTTAGNTGLLLNIALNYGGRKEIVMAAKTIAQKVRDGEIDIDDINETTIEEHLYSKGVPDPDLLIRTAGEMRISNFLLWQIAYTEIWITDVLWPDFNREVILDAVEDYLKRNRKFGAAL
ncbi:MAG: isoprenyl transferase [Bacillota bacterium]